MAAVAVGILFELLLDPTLRGGRPLGAGFALVTVAAAGLAFSGERLIGRRPTGSASMLTTVLAFFGLMVGVRSSVTLVAIDMAVCLGAVLLLAYAYSGPALPGLSISGHLRWAAGGAAAALGEAMLLARDLLPEDRRRSPLARLAGPVVRGLVLAVLPLLAFTLLFVAADAVFADYLHRLTAVDLSAVVQRGLLAAAIAWAAAGLMRRAWHGPAETPPTLAGPRLGVVEAVTALVLLNLLFAAFVVVQFTYLFGGAGTLALSGLTHAEYARRGFFELATVATLAVGLVLVLDWAVKPARVSTVPVDRLHALLLALTGVVLVSALQRMRLYTAAFGLTELRFYTTVFMIWAGAVLVWTWFTALRGRRHRFPFGALVAGLALLAVVNLANPDALIARANVRHAEISGRELDADYLTRVLSADAVPALIESLDRLDPCPASHVARGILEATDRPHADWRSATWGAGRAAGAVEASLLELERLARSC